MKKTLLISILACFIGSAQAQELKSISLNKPNLQRGASLMKALEQRQSTREYAERKLEMQDLSDLLWAAVGINRPESGRRTAPTALNKQEIDVYVCLPEGAYLYNAQKHELTPVAKGDFRPAVADKQAFAKTAPVCLVIVANLEKFNGEILMPAVDAGIVSQNISLFCSGNGLVTVPRASMDQARLKEALKLKESQRPLLNHPVGYAK
ncbi:MAG: SagB/ThcOx family dehydrogenase [Odoribacter sp.]|nr:SagB/ThcOx family dehydrogenase [Odoribacter sp.]